MRIRERLWVGLLAMILAVTASESAIAQQTPPDRTRRFELGADIGLSGGTIDGTAFAVGISGDFPVAPHITIGPLLQIGVTGDLTQLGVTAQAKYTLDLPDVPELKPSLQAGIGFIYADLDFGSSSSSDTSWLIPIGMGLEYRVMKNLAFNTTLLFNFTDIDIRDQEDNFFITWFVGVRFLL